MFLRNQQTKKVDTDAHYQCLHTRQLVMYRGGALSRARQTSRAMKNDNSRAGCSWNISNLGVSGPLASSKHTRTPTPQIANTVLPVTAASKKTWNTRCQGDRSINSHIAWQAPALVNTWLQATLSNCQYCGQTARTLVKKYLSLSSDVANEQLSEEWTSRARGERRFK